MTKEKVFLAFVQTVLEHDTQWKKWRKSLGGMTVGDEYPNSELVKSRRALFRAYINARHVIGNKDD